MNTANRRWDPAIDDDPDASNRFVYYAPLPTLQESAINRAALAIWESYICSHSNLNNVPQAPGNTLSRTLAIGDEFLEECDKMVSSLKAPRSIEVLLKLAVKSVIGETHDWINHFQYESFSDNLAPYWIQHFDINWCVWLPNGKMDWEKTAVKMLSAPGLSFVQKFAIMSEFCMEEEIKKFPWRLLPHSFISQVNFYDEYLMYYWICYVRNKLDAIPLVDDFQSVDAVMAATCEELYWTAFQYFWHRLGDDEQVSVVAFKYSKSGDEDEDLSNHQNRILSQMSWPQQRRLLSKVPHEIMMNFWFNLDSHDSAMWTWDHSKDLMTPAQFAKVVKEVFKDSVFEEDVQLLNEIWPSASDQQRNYVVQTLEDEQLTAIFSRDGQSNAANKFLCQFLSMKSEDSRSQVMFRNAGRFVANIDDPTSMDQVLQLCFPNPADLLEYKNSILESEETQRRFVQLFHEFDFDNLLKKINFCTSDRKKIQDFVEQLIENQGIAKWIFLTNFENWNKFSKFVDEIFPPQDVTSASNLKKQFITSYIKHCRDRFDDERFEVTIKILEMVFTNDDELQLVKKYLLDNYQTFFFSNYYWLLFEEEHFNRFVKWCLNGDEKALEEFIKNVPVDEIFDEYLHQFADSYVGTGDCYKSILRYLDTCLRWYFKGDEGARRYKLKRLDNFMKLRIFQLIVERRDETNLDQVLEWFFDDDEQGVEKFKEERIRVTIRCVPCTKV